MKSIALLFLLATLALGQTTAPANRTAAEMAKGYLADALKEASQASAAHRFADETLQSQLDGLPTKVTAEALEDLLAKSVDLSDKTELLDKQCTVLVKTVEKNKNLLGYNSYLNQAQLARDLADRFYGQLTFSNTIIMQAWRILFNEPLPRLQPSQLLEVLEAKRKKLAKAAAIHNHGPPPFIMEVVRLFL